MRGGERGGWKGSMKKSIFGSDTLPVEAFGRSSRGNGEWGRESRGSGPRKRTQNRKIKDSNRMRIISACLKSVGQESRALGR